MNSEISEPPKGGLPWTVEALSCNQYPVFLFGQSDYILSDVVS